MRKVLYIFISILYCTSLLAQKLKVQVNTKKPIVGVPFEVSFIIDAIPQDFTPPSFKDFEVVSGPNQSQSIQFINGSLSQSFSISYVLIPKKEGAIVLPAAKAIVNNQSVYSSPITLDVQKGNGNYNSPTNSASSTANKPASISVSKDDIFVRTSVNKKQCYVGEQVTLTQKIYTRVELRGIQNVKFPHLEGFWSKNQENNNNIQLHIENIDGVNYYVGEISTQYLFPQRSGKITIPPIEIECVVRKRTNRPPRDIFEQFFGVNAYEDRSVIIKSQPINIHVDELPGNKPNHFAGAVGNNFSYRVEMNKTKIPANEALNLKIFISGNGNIPLVDAPKINFPPEFEVYDPKIQESISTSHGISGHKTFEYLIIPRQEGTYKLSDISFSYFDLNKKTYVTIPSNEIVITVTPPIGNNNNTAQVYQQFKQEVKSENNDIHFIKVYPFSVYQKKKDFFGSPLHISLMLLPYIAIGVLLGFRKYQQNQQSDWATFQQRRAQKIALKHLSVADRMMKENKTSEFYSAIIQAMENYITYKFKLKKIELSKDKIKTLFDEHKIPDNLKNQFFEIINTAELAKYTPVGTGHSLNKIFIDTKNLIIELENHTKNV